MVEKRAEMSAVEKAATMAAKWAVVKGEKKAVKKAEQQAKSIGAAIIQIMAIIYCSEME